MNDAVFFILLLKVTTSSPFNSFFYNYFRGKGKVGYRKCRGKSSGKARWSNDNHNDNDNNNYNDNDNENSDDNDKTIFKSNGN